MHKASCKIYSSHFEKTVLILAFLISNTSHVQEAPNRFTLHGLVAGREIFVSVSRCVYLSMCACMCTCMCACLYVRTYVCIYDVRMLYVRVNVVRMYVLRTFHVSAVNVMMHA